jgi:hypothetical protein
MQAHERRSVPAAHDHRLSRGGGAAEGFPRLRSLGLRLPGSVKMFQALAAAPLLRQLSHLRIEVLIDSPGFQHLSGLHFRCCAING